MINTESAHPYLALAKSSIPVVGTLLGVFVGQFLGKWSEHKQWRRDQKKEEFRELVSLLAAATMERQKFLALSDPNRPSSSMFDDQYSALLAVADRIFIRRDIRRLNVENDFFGALEDVEKDRDFDKFSKRMGRVIDRIVQVAEKL